MSTEDAPVPSGFWETDVESNETFGAAEQMLTYVFNRCSAILTILVTALRRAV